MAGLVFEICKKKNITVAAPEKKNSNNEAELVIEVVPGVPALSSGASLLGAPLSHDFAVISLSDLLTPWDIIEKRLKAAAQADFVIVLYNPKSKKRDWQLEKALKIILQFRDEKTPAGVVARIRRHATRHRHDHIADRSRWSVLRAVPSRANRGARRRCQLVRLR